MPAVQAIQLQRSDTIDAACELLRAIPPSTQVWLILPWRMSFARRSFHLRRLQRSAQDAALDLRVVSQSAEARLLAREAGIPTYTLLPPALWPHRRMSRQAQLGGGQGVQGVPLALRRPPGSLGDLGSALSALFVTLFLLVALAGSAAALMPSASVTIEPNSLLVAASFRVTASPFYREIDYGKAIIPARMVQVIIEGHGSTPTTGREDVPDGHASGEVVFANRTNQSVVVPKGTIVRTSSGVNVPFYTVADIELPPVLYGHARVGIIALEPGTPRIEKLTMNVVEGDVAPLVEVLNDQNIDRGTKRSIGVVAYRDFDQLRAEMIENLQKKAYADLVGELDEGESIPPESLDVQIMSMEYDHVVDQRSDVLSMSMKVVARGIALDEANIRELATQFLVRGAGEGMAVIDQSLEIRRSDSAQMAEDSKSLDLVVEAHGAAAAVIDAEVLKKELSGKTIRRATDWLASQLDLRGEPQITVFPPWWSRMPLLPARTEVLVSAGES